MSEEFYTLVDCECKAKVYLDDKQVDIEYCPKHAAAPELLDALKEIAKGEGAYSRNRLNHAENVIENTVSIAEKAIAKAEGGK